MGPEYSHLLPKSKVGTKNAEELAGQKARERIGTMIPPNKDHTPYIPIKPDLFFTSSFDR